MKKIQSVRLTIVPSLAIAAALLCFAPAGHAQSGQDQSQVQTSQQGMQPEDQSATQKIFTGKIVKSGDKLVLTDTAGKTSYQLDDQQKAQSFLNKSVKVTGILDPSTGTIQVSAIDPA